MDRAIEQALQRLEDLAAKGAIDAKQLEKRRAQLRRQDRVAKLAAVSGCYIVNEGKPVASATTGMASLDLDVLQHMLSFVKSYPLCVLVATTSKQLHPLLIAKPLADRARDAPGELMWDMVVQAMKSQDGLSRAAIKQLAFVAEKFPGALDQRHWPPLSLDDFPEPELPPGRMRHRRAGLARHGKDYLEIGHRFFEQELEPWHGQLPNKPITPLELCVSLQQPLGMEILDDLLKLGAKPTELAITIDMGNMSGGSDAGVFTTTMLRAHPLLVSTTYADLDWIEEHIEGTTCMDSEGFSELLIRKYGVVPEVGVTHSAGGRFSEEYDDECIRQMLRMAQATQLCTKCNTQKACDDFEPEEWAEPDDEQFKGRFCRICNVRTCRKCGTSKGRTDFEDTEWERSDNKRLCRVCNVRDCSKCGASKGRQEFSTAQWKRGATGRECRTCNVRDCSRCGKSRDPYHFPGDEWEKVDRLCLSCKLPPSKRRSCAQCSVSLPQSDFSKKQWGKAANGKGRCKKCLGN
jgi:hypothetical protein